MKTNRIIIYLTIFTITMGVFITNCLAANHYVRANATGNGSGSDWNNAFQSLPSNLIRGDTYYIADGTYSSYTFNDSTSGNTYIYIKKATAADHGTNTGWSSSYGDGQAEFAAQWKFSTSYWDIDGVFGSLDGTFGIKVKRTGSDGKVVTISSSADHVNLSYIDLENSGYSSSSWANADVLYAGVTGGSDSCTFTKCWFHNSNRTLCFLYAISNYTFDGCWFTENINMDAYGVHGEAFSINITPNVGKNTIKNCVFRNIEGSAWIGFMNSFGDRTNYNWDIFNNLFYVDGDHILDGWNGTSSQPSVTDFSGTNGVITVLNSSPAASVTNLNIFGNTFCNMNQSSIVRLDYSGADCYNAYCRNNLMIHPSRIASWDGNTVSNNASYTDTTYVRDYANHNYTLVRATASGYTLSTPYNVDRSGETRGVDGTWDLGAYEYLSSIVSFISPPIGLRIMFQ